MPRDRASLLDVVKAARHIVDFKGDGDEQEFLSDYKTQAAILHELLVIGEAAIGHVSCRAS